MKQLLGSWRLVSIQVRLEDTGETLDLHGAAPRGAILFLPGGRMATLISNSGRTPPKTDAEAAALFRGLSAYSGRYRIEGARVLVEVDVAWHPDWEDTRQWRNVSIEGDRLTLTTDLQDHPAHPGRPLRGIVVWTREA